MYLSTIFLPLLSSIICGFGARFTSKKYYLSINVSFMVITFMYAVCLFMRTFTVNSFVEIQLFKWVEVWSLTVYWGFMFDALALVMICMISFISTIVHLYSTEYMKNDPHLARFMSYLSLFTFFMLLLVSSNNLLQLFVGWEGVGLCSYLLINFWFTRLQANKSALKALIMNRFGDFTFILALVLIYKYFKSFDFAIILDTNIIDWICTYEFTFLFFIIDPITLITTFLFLGAMGKSAQLGLHTWLPDAMEGPTPVSALIHAATMVTAGVFLIIRCSALFSASPITCSLMAFIGILTAIISSTIGLVQYDIKKIIAYSTCSQLGYMIFGCGIHQFSISFFHLINHAFFKALLFLSAGAIIHALNDEQDIRKMGGLINILPFIYTVVLIGSLALMGIPFLTGFYSKDLLLEMAYNTQNPIGQYCFWIGTLGAGITTYYSFRLIFYVFITPVNGFKIVYKQLHEPGKAITLALLILAISSIFFGYYFSEMFVGEKSIFLSTNIYSHIINNNYDIPFSIPIFYKFLPFFISIFCMILSLIILQYFNKLLVNLEFFNFFFRLLFILFNKKWFFDFIYNKIGYFFLNSSYYLTYVFFDKGLLEILGPLGLSNIITYLGFYISRLQNGFITNGVQLLMLGFYLFLASIGLLI